VSPRDCGTSDELIKYRDEQRIAIPLSIDETGATFRAFAVKEVPTLLVIDPKGRLTRRVDKVSDDWAVNSALRSGEQSLVARADRRPEGGCFGDVEIKAVRSAATSSSAEPSIRFSTRVA